jgi:dihydrofolate synthase/folylpolyglutamate synthase
MRRRARRRAEVYLTSRIRFGMKFGLETMQALVEALGHPERAFPTILVAGTNGKGSVVAYADAVLRASGLRVGRYTSPHLVRVNERIVVGGHPIGDQALDVAVGRVRTVAEALGKSGTLAGQPTYFEVLTAAALLHFAHARVDVAVLEVGMGARLDATNVTDPICSAIVTVERDHEAYLGTTLDAIAREKAGVLRPRRVTVIGPMAPEARSAIEDEAARVGARLVDAARDTEVQPRERASMRSTAGPGGHEPFVDVVTPRGIHRRLRPLPGAHQRANLAVAIRLLEETRATGLGVDLAATRAGVGRTHWPGRLQRIPGQPPLLLDGAHNPAAARALGEALRAEPPFVLIFGAMVDKDVAEMGRILFPLARDVVLTNVPSDRAASPEEIARRVGPPARRAQIAPTVAAALARARRLAGRRGLVVVAGSLYLTGEVLRSVAARRGISPPARRGPPSRPRK